MSLSLYHRISAGFLVVFLSVGAPVMPVLGMQCGTAEEPESCACEGMCCAPEASEVSRIASADAPCCVAIALEAKELDQAIAARPAMPAADPLQAVTPLPLFADVPDAPGSFHVRSGGPPGPASAGRLPVFLSTLLI